MGQHEPVTFAAGGLDRAAHLRAAPPATGRTVPLWRSKPLVRGADATRDLVWVAPDHPAFADATDPALFLGLRDGVAHFARDLDGWVPDALPGDPDSFLDTTEQIHPAFRDGARFVELRACMTRLTAADAECAATARALLAWHARHRFCANCGAPTAPSQAGWQRDCPDCRAQHYPRTDPVVIMLITHGNSVLVGRSPGWPDGMYSLLAGFVEPGETIEAAVRREVLEEAGLTVGAVRYVVSQPWPFPASLMLACAGDAETTDITCDPNELEDARWVSREEMLDVFAGRHPEMTAARRGAVARHVLERWLADRLEG